MSNQVLLDSRTSMSRIFRIARSSSLTTILWPIQIKKMVKVKSN